MIRIRANGNKLNTKVKKYVVDTFEEIESINIKAADMGSTVFVISTSETYMLNGQRKWVKVALSGGSAEPGDNEVIYDGGVIGESESDHIIYEGGVL